MNDVLVKHYLCSPSISKEDKDKLSVVKADNAHILLLNEVLGTNWTYEILSEEYIEDGTAYCVNIVLYLPGIVRPGVGRSNIDFNREHKFEAIAKAIKNACQSLRIGTRIDKGIQPSVNTDKASEPSKDTNVSKVEPKIEGPKKDDVQVVEQKRVQSPSKYTTEQIERMKEFKANFSIETNEQFMKYINSWDPTIKAKSQLTPDNIDTFLDWIDKIGNIAMDV